MSSTLTGATAPPPDLSSTPPSLSNRIFSLDVLRGIAILGALVVSIWVFGGFSEQQRNQLLLQSKGSDYRIFGTIELLFTGKMRAIIAIVFGAAMVYFLSREQAPGKKPLGDVFIKRQIWLIIFGLVNAMLFLWPMDILFHLGIMGILLFPFFRLNTRSLFIAALLVTLVYSGKIFWDYSDDKRSYSKYMAATELEKKFEKDSIQKAKAGLAVKKDTLTKFQQQDKQQWEGMIAGMKVDLKKDDPNIKAMRSGSYTKVWDHVLPKTQSQEVSWMYRLGVWDFAGMILLGMLLYKLGFFTNGFSKSRYWLIALAGIAGGLLLGWLRIHFQQMALQDYEKYVKQMALPYKLLFPVERGLMAIGYCSLLMALLYAGFLRKIWEAFSSVGKMALTNYLLQSIICTIFFYGYGMGYFSRLSQTQLYFMVAEVSLVQIAFSVTWLKYFNIGPAEWLLRRLSYGKWLPQKFSKPVAGEPVITVLS
jgi:uncharacterized protein